MEELSFRMFFKNFKLAHYVWGPLNWDRTPNGDPHMKLPLILPIPYVFEYSTSSRVPRGGVSWEV